MKIKFELDSDKVRALCIKEDFYTRGTNEEYSHLLCDLCTDCDTEDKLSQVAFDILLSSDYERLANRWGVGDRKALFDIIERLILNECCYFYLGE